MKKTFYLIAFFTLCSCVPKYSEYIYVSDFAKYVQSGFYIYPKGTEIKEREYYPTADIEMDFFIGRKSEDAIKSGLQPTKNKENEIRYIPTGEYIIEKVVEEAKKRGANAIISYQVQAIKTGGRILGYNATGVAVKIK